MIRDSTLLMCEIVLKRYLDVLSEHPDSVTAEFRALVSSAAADVGRERNDQFMNLSRQILEVPTETDQASLLQATAKK